MTPHQKSALEIGGVVLAGAVVLWYLSSNSASPSGQTADQSLPVYGGAADPGSTTATIPSVAPLSSWNTQPYWPADTVPDIIWPSPNNNGLANLLKALNPASNNCCGCPADALQALVSATPTPYTGSESGITPPAPGLSTLAMYLTPSNNYSWSLSGNLASFVQTYLPYAQQTSAQTGLPVDYILAQSAEETGYGTSNAALNLNNFFGISPGGSLASYGSPAAGFAAYGNLINSGYSSAAQQTSSLGIAQAMVAGGYNTADPNYANTVSGIVPSVDAVLSSLGVSSGSQFGPPSPSGTSSASVPSGTTQASATTAAQDTGILATVGGFVSKIGIVLLGIGVVVVGLWMLAKGEGSSLLPRQHA